MASMLLMGVAVVLITQLYTTGAAMTIRAEARTEAEAVLEWFAAEYSTDGCAAPVRVTTLGPDALTPHEGFAVECVALASVDYPPPAYPLPPPGPPTATLSDPPQARQPITVSVSWEMDGVPRTIRRTAWGP